MVSAACEAKLMIKRQLVLSAIMARMAHKKMPRQGQYRSLKSNLPLYETESHEYKKASQLMRMARKKTPPETGAFSCHGDADQ